MTALTRGLAGCISLQYIFLFAVLPIAYGTANAQPSLSPGSVALEVDGSRFAIATRDMLGINWREYNFGLLDSWYGKPIRLLAEDQSIVPVSFSEPAGAPARVPGVRETGSLLWRTVLHLFLMAIPAFATCSWLAARGRRDFLLLGPISLLVPAISGYIAFWLWFINPRIGRGYSLLLPVVATVVSVTMWQKLDSQGRKSIQVLLTPFALTGAVALLVLSVGFLYGGERDPHATAALRFSHPLPADNFLPYLLAERLRDGHVPKPLFIDWLSSDRPPLQVGMVLSQYAYLRRPRDFGYTVASVILQAQWLFALWLLLKSLDDVDTGAVALGLTVSIFSGFTFVHSFFVWPKLLAATYGLALIAVLLSPRSRSVLGNKWMAIFAGAFAALAMLSHGGMAFALIGLVPTLLLLRKKISYRELLSLVLTASILYLPWILYQKLYDPPGDRLLKWHLAGVVKVDKRPFSQVLGAAYRKLSFTQWLNYKLANVNAIAGHKFEYWRTTFELLRDLVRGAPMARKVETASYLRGLKFFYFIPNMGVLAFGPLAFLLGFDKRRRSPEWRVAGSFWLYIVLTLGIWCLLMFIPGSTILHTGSYSIVLLAFIASILALWAVAPWLAWIIATIEIAINFLSYGVLTRETGPNGPVPQGSLRYAMLALAVACVTGVAFLLYKMARRGKNTDIVIPLTKSLT